MAQGAEGLMTLDAGVLMFRGTKGAVVHAAMGIGEDIPRRA